VGWWWRRASAAAGLALGLIAAPATGAELRRAEVVQGAEGVAVHLVLSHPTRATVHRVEREDGALSRVYVDLPRGVGLARGAAGSVAALPPLGALRVGIGEGGIVRVVAVLREPGAYGVTQRQDGSVLALDIRRPEHPGDEGRAAAEVSPGRKLRRSPGVKIVLDPGHGGDDPGAHGYAVEKEVTLAVTRRLARLLEERLGALAVLTRADDATVALADRTARANTEGADLFLSIHANASPNGSMQGVETYYLNNSDDRATIRLAAMENGLDLLSPPRGRADLRYILSDLVQVGKMEESIALATAVQGGLVRRLQDRHPDVVDRGVKQGPFYVLVGAYMPCALVETSFLTHPREGRRLAGRPYQDAVAEGLFEGVARFLADARQARTL
jgi:N-acetylmuramoyl-L-alanine amidase